MRSPTALPDAMVCTLLEQDRALSPSEQVTTLLDTIEFQAIRRYLGKRRHSPGFHSELPANVRDWATQQ